MSGAMGVSARTDPATEAVETTMYRALAVLRVVVLINSFILNIYFWETLTRPTVAVATLSVMALWTAVAVWAYDRPELRRLPLLATDLAIAVGTILVSPLAKGPEISSTVPGFWVMGAVLAWAIRAHWTGGLVASVTVSVADVAVRTDLNQTNYGNIFLLMIGGPVVGYTSGLLKEMATARDRAEHEAAAARERARLARVVHDGVLQVLALVQRRGLELGGEAAQLGRLAGEQEVALRSLVQGESRPRITADPHPRDRDRDLTQVLRTLASPSVSVSVPGTPVELPSSQVDEILAAVHACLDNVRRHVGAGARAWVLLEDVGSEIVVTVRDDGPGIGHGRLEEAEAQGRLGIAQSIRGRVADLGGAANLVTAPGQGTEWELSIPRDAV